MPQAVPMLSTTPAYQTSANPLPLRLLRCVQPKKLSWISCIFLCVIYYSVLVYCPWIPLTELVVVGVLHCIRHRPNCNRPTTGVKLSGSSEYCGRSLCPTDFLRCEEARHLGCLCPLLYKHIQIISSARSWLFSLTRRTGLLLRKHSVHRPSNRMHWLGSDQRPLVGLFDPASDILWD